MRRGCHNLLLIFSVAVILVSPVSQTVTLNHPTQDLTVYPSCSLGVLTDTDVISVKVSTQTAVGVGNLKADITYNDAGLQQTNELDFTCPIDPNQCEVTFPAIGVNQVNPQFVNIKDSTGNFDTLFNPIKAIYYKNGQIVCSTSDVLREDISRVIYFPAERATTTFTVASQDQDNELRLYRFNDPASNSGAITRIDNTAECDAVTYDAATKTQTMVCNDLVTGFYVVRPKYLEGDQIRSAVTFSYESSSYACPFDPSFPDTARNYPGCTLAISQDDLPCAVYNSVRGECELCIPGGEYYLEDGKCYFKKVCGQGLYLHYGGCWQGTPNCQEYDFAGVCLKCVSTQYKIVNGVCQIIVPECGDRQYLLNNVCTDVSIGCGSFSANGLCQTCRSKYYSLSNGVCTLIDCPANEYVSAKAGFICQPIPRNCVIFILLTEVCNQCINGYNINVNGQCQRLSCPDRQYPSPTENVCLDVSPLCKTYDPDTGKCLSCNQVNHQVQENGSCATEVNPLAGCGSRQRLGFGLCTGASLNCARYDSINNICRECNSNYQIDFQGLCRRLVPCPPGHFSQNFYCTNLPPNCLSVNQNGFCTQCVDPNLFNNFQGRCVPKVTCQAGRYLTSTFQCALTNPGCALINPSNGRCITCADNSEPYQGYCCGTGLIYQNFACVPETSVVNAGGSACVAMHPSILKCVRCNPGYKPSRIVLTSCVPEQSE